MACVARAAGLVTGPHPATTRCQPLAKSPELG